jgi:hypothetical protein
MSYTGNQPPQTQGLSDPVTIDQGGTGAITSPAAKTALGVDTGATGATVLASGTTGQQTSPSVVSIRYNITTSKLELANGVSWANVGGGGGATGGGTDTVMYENDLIVSQSYTIGDNSMSVATISIASPAVITHTNTYVANQPVRFSTTGALPTGLDATALYYVIATGLSTSSFRVSLTIGGAAVNTSGTQSGVHSCGKVKNASSAGNVTILDGVTVTVPTGATWSIS